MSGEWDTIGGKMLDLNGINGGWKLCFGSLSPWGTPLLSEELYFEIRLIGIFKTTIITKTN